MSRPLYENNKTRESEKFFLFLFPQYVKLPIQYGADFISLSEYGPTLAELKTRNMASYEVPDQVLWLSWAKVETIQRFPHREARLFFLLTDGLFYIRIQDYKRLFGGYPDLTFGGRTDRNDWQDLEPLVQYRVPDLIPIYNAEELENAHKEYAALSSLR